MHLTKGHHSQKARDANEDPLLRKVQEKLKQCLHRKDGLFNQSQAEEYLNSVIKEHNPEAFTNPVETLAKKRQHQRTRVEQAKEHERALFDFDEDINDLEKVTERYASLVKTKNEETKKPKEASGFVSLVKRTERPNLPGNVLADLERIKK